MGRPATLAVRITANAQGAQRGAQQAQRAFSGLGSTIKNALGAAAAYAGVDSIVKFGSDTVRIASEVQQNFGALDAVFKGNAGQMKKWANSAAQSVGLSKEQYSGLAVTLGSTLKNMGVSQGQLGGTTDKLIKKAADLSSMFGGTTAEAVEALTSAFKGETDPIEKYGISISAASVKAYKAANKTKHLTDTQARMALIFKQSKDSQGNFGKESDTLAGKTQRLSAQWDNMKGAIGERLLPVLTTLSGFVNTTLLPALSKLPSWITGTAIPALQAFWQKFTEIGSVVLAIAAPFLAFAAILAGPMIAAFIASNVQLGLLALRIAAVTVAQNIASVASKAWALATGILNAVMSANPLVLVAALIIALGVAIFAAYKKSATFRRICQQVWQVIKKVGSAIAGAFVAAWNGLKAAIGWVVGKVSSVIRWFGRIKVPSPLALIKAGFGKIRDAGGWVVDKVGSVIRWLGKIKVPNPLDALKKAFNGVKDAAGWVVDKIKDVINWIKKIPGGGLLGKAIDKVTYSSSRAVSQSAGPFGYALPGPRGRGPVTSFNPSFHLTVSIDGQQLQGRISRTVNRALNADGARLAAGGWA